VAGTQDLLRQLVMLFGALNSLRPFGRLQCTGSEQRWCMERFDS